MSLILPELPPCPYHPDKPEYLPSKCAICWKRFYIPFNHINVLNRINAEIKHYHDDVERAKQYIALRERGFETNAVPPVNTLITFALPNGKEVIGRNLDDHMGGTFPVKEDEYLNSINEYLGWKLL